MHLDWVCYNRLTMVERLNTGKIELIGKGTLKITAKGVDKIIIEQAAPRKIVDNGNPEKITHFGPPKGTIESLYPLLREITGADNSENADGYWMGVDKKATMLPQNAVNKLKRAGYGHLETANLLIKSDPLISMGMALNNFSQEEVDVKVSEVATLLLPLFQNKSSKQK